MTNPIMLYAPLDGSLAFQDRAGVGTLTGSGAIRYAPAEGTRRNKFANPYPLTSTGGGIGDGLTALKRVIDDGVESTYSYEAVSTAGVGSFITNNAHMEPLRNTDAHTISFAIRLVSGYTTWRYRIENLSGDNGFISSGAYQDIVLTTEWTRIAVAVTPAANAHWFRLRIRPGVGATDTTCRITDIMVEEGGVASPVPSLLKTGTWLHPVFGLVTAHGSGYLTERCATWVEEGTTQLVTNPWCTNVSTGWAARNGTHSVREDYTFNTIFVGNVAATAANSEAYISITAALASHMARAVVINRHTASRTFQLMYNGSDIGNPVVVAARSLGELSAAFTGTGSAAELAIKVTDSVSGENWCHVYLGAEQKTYVTSYSPAIGFNSFPIQPGYTWTGVAHASTSTRTATVLSTAVTDRIDDTTGAMVARFRPSLKPNPGRIVTAGESGVGLSAIYLSTVDSFLAISTPGNGDAFDDLNNSGIALAMVADTWYVGQIGWDATTQYVYDQNDVTDEATGTRDQPPQGDMGVSHGIQIGTLSSSQHLDGYIGPVAIYDRRLSESRRTQARDAIANDDDLWELFADWTVDVTPASLALTSGSMEATAGAAADISPADLVLAEQLAEATAGVAADVTPGALVLAGQEVSAIGVDSESDRSFAANLPDRTFTAMEAS